MSDRSAAFEAFFAEHYESVFRDLAVAFGDTRLADEAAQEAFTRAHLRRSRISRTARPRQWLYVTAARAGLARTDRDRPIASSEPDTLERAIEALPERERLALVLHHRGGLAPKELARALRCSDPAAMSTLREARRLLGIEPDDDDDIPQVELDDP